MARHKILFCLLLVVMGCSYKPQEPIIQVVREPYPVPQKYEVVKTDTLIITDCIPIGDLEKIYFDYNSDKLKLAEEWKLVQLADKWFKCRDKLIILRGGADKRGKVLYNYQLGNRRCESVRTKLINLGIPFNHILQYSMGEDINYIEGVYKYNRVVIIDFE